MNKEYYNKFSIGLIDRLLIKLDQEYSMLINVDGETRNQNKQMRIRHGQMIEQKAWIGEKNGPIVKQPEQSVHEWLCKLNMMPTLSKDIDYNKEYPSPFTDSVTKALLMLRWITGLQAMNGQSVVEITKKELKEIGLDHKSVMDVKILFDKLFRPVISHYNDGTWSVKIGGRDAVPGEGPGNIKIKVTQFTGLFNSIFEHHNKILKESTDVNHELRAL